MLPKIGTANLRVTLGAGLVDGLPNQLLLRRITVGAVTTAAVHLALPDRMRVRFQYFGTRLLMTVKTHLRLGHRCQHRIALGVAAVAIRARDRIFVVATTVPRKTGIVLMTVDTHAILLGNRCNAARTELDDCGSFLTTPDSTRVVTARAVARLALQLTMTKR